MSRGFTGTTQKQRRSPHNGNNRHPRGQRKHGRSAATSRFCWPFFSTPVGWCITNTHHKAKQSPNYCEGLLCRLRNAVQRKRPNLWAAETWQLHHNNTPTHSSHLIQGFLAKHNIPLIPQAPYSPNMAPCVFGCSPNWKCRWKGPDLSQEKTLCGTRRPSCTGLHKNLSSNISSNGRTARRSVCITKETTLKGIRVSNVK